MNSPKGGIGVTTMGDHVLAELIVRLVCATGPNYELECDIAREVGTYSVTHRVPAYTASLDAALTLVPEGYHWWADWVGKCIWSVAGRAGVTEHFRGDSEHPAIALCIAALRARQSLQSSKSKD